MNKKKKEAGKREEEKENPSEGMEQPPVQAESGSPGEESSEVQAGEVAVEEISPEELKDLREKARERDEFLDKLKRARADYLNYQKRVEREREDFSKFVFQDFFSSLLPVVDNLQRAIGSSEKSKDFDKFLEGIKMVERLLLKVLGNGGVKSIEAEGKPFDPEFHEAAFQVENEGAPNSTVLEEIEKGYLFHDRVLRASKVVVSKRSEKAGEEKEEGEAGEEEELEAGAGGGGSVKVEQEKFEEESKEEGNEESKEKSEEDGESK